MIRLGSGVALLLVSTLSAGCGDGIPAPAADTYLVVLDSPFPDDGALLLTVDAPTPPTVAAASSVYRVYTRARADGTVGVAVIGNLQSGPMLRLHFAIETDGDEVRVAVSQVADRANELRPTTDGYAFELVRP